MNAMGSSLYISKVGSSESPAPYSARRITSLTACRSLIQSLTISSAMRVPPSNRFVLMVTLPSPANVLAFRLPSFSLTVSLLVVRPCTTGYVLAVHLVAFDSLDVVAVTHVSVCQREYHNHSQPKVMLRYFPQYPHHALRQTFYRLFPGSPGRLPS